MTLFYFVTRYISKPEESLGLFIRPSNRIPDEELTSILEFHSSQAAHFSPLLCSFLPVIHQQYHHISEM
jgi:hypothetical protein